MFVGGFTLDAEAIYHGDLTGSSEPPPERSAGAHSWDRRAGRVGSLVDSNLIRAEELLVGEPRFWMLETIREYGLEQLGTAGEEATCRGATWNGAR